MSAVTVLPGDGLELVLDARAELGEGAIWDGERVVWVDIHQGLVHWYDPRTGGDEVLDAGCHVGAVAPRRDGGLVLAVRDGFAVLEPGSRHLQMIAEVEGDIPENRMNDGACDPAGRFWAGTMSLVTAPDAGALYRLDPDGSVHRALAPTSISNGIDWNEDATTMYFVDTPREAVEAFDFDVASGAISRRRTCVAVDGPGRPDGMILDARGRIWVAVWGGSQVRRYSPDGALEIVIELPVSQVTSCAFGGADLADLYITTAHIGLPPEVRAQEPLAGGLFRYRLETDHAGRPTRSYHG